MLASRYSNVVDVGFDFSHTRFGQFMTHIECLNDAILRFKPALVKVMAQRPRPAVGARDPSADRITGAARTFHPKLPPKDRRTRT